jgi:hypothetical protein
MRARQPEQRPLPSSSCAALVRGAATSQIASQLLATHFLTATGGGTLFPMTSTDKESQMTISLGTASEMTKGWDVGPVLDTQEKVLMGAFVRYLQIF